MKSRAMFAIVLIILLIPQFTIFASPAQPAEDYIFSVVEDLGEYRLSKYDVIDIAVIGFSETEFPWGKQVMVGPDGYINVPYVGTLKIAGLTTTETSRLLKDKLSFYFHIPELSVMVREYGSRQVYVMGEVKTQGVHKLSSDHMNVFAAISEAGGLTQRGRGKHIAVIRVIGKDVLVRKVDLNAFIKKQDIRQNVRLQDGDMVYVPKSNKIILAQDVMPWLNLMLIYDNLKD